MPNTNTNANPLFRENSFRLIGTLKDANITNGNRKDNGQAYVSANLIITNVMDGNPCEYEVNVFSNKLTQDGKESQLYVSYTKLGELVGKKVDISGEIRENRYWSTNLKQMVSAQQLSGRFVRGVADSTADDATFVLGGFIAKTPVERTNKKGEVYRYDITIGQSNFKGDRASMFTLHVNPNDREILSGVESYEVGATVQLTGKLSFTVEQVTVEDNNTAFGAPVTRTYTNKQKNFYILSGSNPYEDERAYSPDVIQKLIAAYKAHDVELANAAGNSSNDEDHTSPVAPISKRQASLI